MILNFSNFVGFSGAEESYTIQYLDASSCSIDESVLIQSLSVSSVSVQTIFQCCQVVPKH